jgi:hypothetical protein
MLLSLPYELIERIFRLSLPKVITSKTYRQRQAALRILCLVSPVLRDIAQPILREIIFTVSYRRWQQALYRAAADGWASRVRWIVPSDQFTDREFEGEDEDSSTMNEGVNEGERRETARRNQRDVWRENKPTQQRRTTTAVNSDSAGQTSPFSTALPAFARLSCTMSTT